MIKTPPLSSESYLYAVYIKMSFCFASDLGREFVFIPLPLGKILSFAPLILQTPWLSLPLGLANDVFDGRWFTYLFVFFFYFSKGNSSIQREAWQKPKWKALLLF